MRKKYGSDRVFYAKANKFGKGKSAAKKANSVYSKGSHRVRLSLRKRRKK